MKNPGALARRISQKLGYFTTGFTGRIGTSPCCPACGGVNGQIVDRKWLHSLIECQSCWLLYRYPSESADQMSMLYTDGYVQPGLTTDLPDEQQLKELMATGFANTEKDFSYHGSILRALGLREGNRLLDYGANWGYASWQFARQGFIVTSFEPSAPRASFGEKLGLTIHTNIASVSGGFDAVYSCHVLEHTSNPRAVLQEQLELVRPGGLVIAHTPNGSRDHRLQASRSFHLVWGHVHPVLLTDRFVKHVAGNRPFFISSDDRPENVAGWDHQQQVLQSTAGPGFFFAIRRPS